MRIRQDERESGNVFRVDGKGKVNMNMNVEIAKKTRNG